MYNFSMLLDDNMHGDFKEKIGILNTLLINNMEINDFIFNKSITKLNGEEIERVRNILIENNKKIVLLNCNKDISHTEYYKDVFKKAHLLGIENVKAGFSMNSLQDKQCDNDCDVGYSGKFDEIKKNLDFILKLGESYGIGVLTENNSSAILTQESEINNLCREQEIDKSRIGLIFNPLEYVKLKKHPFFHVFYNSKLKNNIIFLRITDGLYVDGSSTLPGQGNGEVKEMASALLSRGFKGYFSFIPYLKDTDQHAIVNRFKSMLKEL